MISWAFIDSKVLSVAAGMPWVLCDGDVAAKPKGDDGQRRVA